MRALGVEKQARIGQGRIVDSGAVIGNQALGLFPGFRKSGAHDKLDHRNAFADLEALSASVGSSSPTPPFSKTSRAVASAAFAASARGRAS